MAYGRIRISRCARRAWVDASDVHVSNASLMRARNGGATDEWCTSLRTVDTELSRHVEALHGRSVHLNCDGPESMFARWFADHAGMLHLAALTCTRWNPDAHTLFQPAASGDRWDWTGAGWEHSHLAGDGSYASRECLQVSRRADLVCTNPPFSRFTDYVPRLLDTGADLLVLGPLSLVKSDPVFPYVLSGRLRFGYTCSQMTFLIDGRTLAVLRNARWYTTLPVCRPVVSCEGSRGRPPTVDGMPDVCLVDRLVLLSDEPGLYAVPLTFLDRWPTPGWRLHGLLADGAAPWKLGVARHEGRELFTRLLVERVRDA